MIPFDGFDVAIGDLVGYYEALRVKTGDFGYAPRIANTVSRNGIALAHDVAFGGSTMSIECSLVDTIYLGDALFVRHYDELGVSIGSDHRGAATTADLRVGLGFLFAPNAHGFRASLRGRF